jgi:hypothetical protein
VGWLVAAVLIGAVVPFTLIAIMFTNQKLLAPDRDLRSAETRNLLQTWSKLHLVHRALSLAATVLHLWLLRVAPPYGPEETSTAAHLRRFRFSDLELVVVALSESVQR